LTNFNNLNVFYRSGKYTDTLSHCNERKEDLQCGEKDLHISARQRLDWTGHVDDGNVT